MSSKHVPESIRRAVFDGAGGCCEYCRHQAEFSEQMRLCVDHILPRSRGGETSFDNLALACTGCNSHKSIRTHATDPETGQLVHLFHPRKQRWGQHFTWSHDASLILGRTATGRATVEALHLNREGLQSVRRILYASGKHPPSNR
ncbi:MAG: HNH endonuclease [Armatimonadetes bacterium]|nr:HNH endonuclease [Armatimonadota bacterium]